MASNKTMCLAGKLIKRFVKLRPHSTIATYNSESANTILVQKNLSQNMASKNANHYWSVFPWKLELFGQKGKVNQRIKILHNDFGFWKYRNDTNQTAGKCTEILEAHI